MNEHAGPIIARNGSLRVIDCQNCGFAHLDPLPDSDSVQNYYAALDSLYTRFSPNQLGKEAREYRQGWWNSAFKFQSFFLLGSRVCDVGSGAGWFLDFFSGFSKGTLETRGWGIEPSETARRVARENLELKLFPDWKSLLTTLGEIGVRTVDSIRLSLVLEHVLDPKQFLLENMVNLSPTGNLLIIVPNEMNPLQRQIKEHQDWWVSPVHINYFTPESLRRLLHSVGLTVLWEGATFPMELFHFLGIHYIGRERLGRVCHWLRLIIERIAGPQIFLTYQEIYKRWGCGRELIFLASRHD